MYCSIKSKYEYIDIDWRMSPKNIEQAIYTTNYYQSGTNGE
jgi:hypothetical protein